MVLTLLAKSASMTDKEWQRLQELTSFERAAHCQGFKRVVGLDEAGRGPLAGPVVAAACYIPYGLYFPGINDSKKLSAKQRAILFEQLRSDARIFYGLGIVSHLIIDKINIYQATLQAMQAALDALSEKLGCLPDCLLVDGMTVSYGQLPCQKIIKGDAKSQSIAAASILAKCKRDQLMVEYHHRFPEYGFDQHKGYGTLAHREKIKLHGSCAIHRQSFYPIKSRV